MKQAGIATIDVMQQHVIEWASALVPPTPFFWLGRGSASERPQIAQEGSTTFKRGAWLSHDFWGGSSGSLGTVEKEAVPEETASWMPQAQTPSWRRTQGKRLRQKNSWLGSCSETFEGGQAAVSEHRKRGRATGDGNLDATGPDAKLETDTRKAATPEEQLVGKLQRNFWGGSSSSLGRLKKEAVPEETASWMPQAQTPSWRRTQGKRLRQKNSWLGSCSETFEGGQAAVSEH